jgi:hypothetical protein
MALDLPSVRVEHLPGALAVHVSRGAYEPDLRAAEAYIAAFIAPPGWPSGWLRQAVPFGRTQTYIVATPDVGDDEPPECGVS